MEPKVLIVIPARFKSTRYPAKPLVEIKGCTGISKPLVQRSWEAAMEVKGVSRVVVATDNSSIQEVAQSFGADVIMTSESCRNGTERCAEVVEQLSAEGENYDLVVNLQGDAPLTPHIFVESLIQSLTENSHCDVATPAVLSSNTVLQALINDRKAGRVGGTTVVFGEDQRALYFSKEVIPFCEAPSPEARVYHHLGVYAYRPSALAAYARSDQCTAEKMEGLEQIRFLNLGVPVRCTVLPHYDCWELNNPEDLPIIEELLAKYKIQ